MGRVPALLFFIENKYEETPPNWIHAGPGNLFPGFLYGDTLLASKGEYSSVFYFNEKEKKRFGPTGHVVIQVILVLR